MVQASYRLGGYDPFPIRKIFVPQTGHVPLVAGLPFFRVTCSGPLISLFVLHLRQYASIGNPLKSRLEPLYLASRPIARYIGTNLSGCACGWIRHHRWHDDRV